MITQYLVDLYHKYNQEIVMLIVMILSILLLIIVIKTIIFSIIKSYIDKWHHDYNKIFEKYSIYTYLLHTLLSLYFIFWSNVLYTFSSVSYWIISIKDIVIILYTGSFITLLTLSMVEVLADIYRNKIAFSVQAYLSLYTQISKIFIISVATIVIISSVLNISLSTFFTSLGAATALLTFVLKDTVTGLLSGLQLIFHDIIRIGDFVTVKQYNVEGTIEKITITIVKIKNTNHTISTLPTSSFLATNVVNWRGITKPMIKKNQRTICIDINSIVFVPVVFIQELKKSSYLAKGIMNKVDWESIDGDITNIKILRLYIKEYLKNHSAMYNQNFTFLVRQLAPTHNGLPIELHIFTNETRGDICEDIQIDIFDHLFGVISELKLKAFQNKNL